MTMVERAGVCTLDCPVSCSLTDTVDAGRIVKVRGSHALPYTDGVICNKVAHHTGGVVPGPRRLHTPLRRVGPRRARPVQRGSWGQALATVPARGTGRLDSWGPPGRTPPYH